MATSRISAAYRFAQPAGAAALLGESPAVDDRTGHVWWVDIAGRQLNRTHKESGETEAWPSPEEPGFVVLLRDGTPAIGMETGIFAFEPESSGFRKLIDQPRGGHRFNDATVGADGTLFVSTMTRDVAAGEAAIFRVDRSAALVPVTDGLTIPNGMVADLKRERFYFSDSEPRTRRIWVADLDPTDDTIGTPALFASMEGLPGRPDGAAVDASGRYWIAAVDGAALYVYTLSGEREFEVPLPVRYPTKLAFLGTNRDSLVVTSKADGQDGGKLLFVTFPHGTIRGTAQHRWRFGG
ncbi:SMP-30/gluconolactonase/LRE family protein [Martelella radicis]|uniref:Sugar lactone lactonase YvrE n=1 Tax=Martelella radicis TaxID=1397476 RepID=A0A7W6KMI5_9HYPH|nr:SMP-30/gluconolactonase/LRE family protein [Martelella radicis]MBB4124018.1 sugar lactone lactonase YvrE [Martelella radicis]